MGFGEHSCLVFGESASWDAGQRRRRRRRGGGGGGGGGVVWSVGAGRVVVGGVGIGGVGAGYSLEDVLCCISLSSLFAAVGALDSQGAALPVVDGDTGFPAGRVRTQVGVYKIAEKSFLDEFIQGAVWVRSSVKSRPRLGRFMAVVMTSSGAFCAAGGGGGRGHSAVIIPGSWYARAFSSFLLF
jgi:hypothetical protein